MHASVHTHTHTHAHTHTHTHTHINVPAFVSLTDIVPAVDILAPDLEVQLGPPRQAFAGVVHVQRVCPNHHLAIRSIVYLCLPLVQAL